MSAVPQTTLDLARTSLAIERSVSALFTDGMDGREDSRAFGAMIERAVSDGWEIVCREASGTPLPKAGARSIFDRAMSIGGVTLGVDVKTKDLDDDRYSDGGVCAVGNLLKFMANDAGFLIVLEIGHKRDQAGPARRRVDYVHAAPFHLLPLDAYRIENLGTGQVRLNSSIADAWSRMEWKRPVDDFYEAFLDLADRHYARVAEDAKHRSDDLAAFKARGFKDFSFSRPRRQAAA